MRLIPTFRRCLVTLVIVACVLGIGNTVAFAEGSSPASVTTAGPSCRYGVAALSEQQYNRTSTLGAGWYLNFSPTGYTADGPTAFVPVVRVNQNKQGCTYLPGYRTQPLLTDAALGALVRSRLGSLWIVGNEPDRGPNPESCTQGVQDDTQPDVFAQAYHDVYQFIKRIDPTARFANAGLVQVTPGRLQYLDRVWDAYQRFYGMPWPVDVWNMHLYILPEVDPSGKPNGIAGIAVGTDPALGIRESGNDRSKCADPQVYCWAEHDDMGEFVKQLTAMRTWMKAHGQQNKPLILSEYSLLYPYIVDAPGLCFLTDEFGNCFTPTRVRDFMNTSLDYLQTATDANLGYPRDGNRLVQRWLWFSVHNDGVGAASNLADSSLVTLTLPGLNYQGRATAAIRQLNLYPARTSGAMQPNIGLAPTATATLTAEIRNVGALDLDGKVTVTFYSDASLTQPIGSVVIVNAIRGCEANGVRVTVNWPGLTRGNWDFWVVVDPANTWPESDEADNIVAGTVFIGEKWLFQPAIFAR